MIQQLESDCLISYRQEKKRTATTLLAVSISSLLSVSFGFVLYFPNPLKAINIQWYTASHISFHIGSSIGSIFAGIFIDKYGRKWTIIITSIIYFLGYVLLIAGCPEIQKETDLSEFFTLFGCIYCGIGVGMTSHAVPVYIAEVSSAHLRATMGAITHHAIVFGIFLFSVTTEILDWNISYYYSAIFGISVITLSFLMIFMPETPRWLLANDKKDEGFQNLLWLLGNESNAEDECNEIEISLAHQEIASFNDFRSPGLFRPLLIGSLLFFIHQFMLIVYIIYISDLFEHYKQLYIILTYFALQLMFAMFGCFIVDRFPHRYLLLSGSAILFLCSTGSAIYHHLVQPLSREIRLAYLAIYAITFTITWGPLPWIIVSEIFPPRARGLLGGIVRSFIWLLFIPMEIYFEVLVFQKSAASLWFTACVFFLSILFVYYIVPETRGLTLEEIERYYLTYHGFRNHLL